jgi:hypothetical protein
MEKESGDKMIIKNVKRKCAILSILLILVGAVISSIGFGAAGFNFDKFKASVPQGNSLQTIHMNSKGDLWYGLDFGTDFHLFVLGEPD